MNTLDCDIASHDLADGGRARIEWADREMPVLQSIRDRFQSEKPLKGQRIVACLHITTETANLLRTLKAGGAEVAACASNPLSTQDDVAAALVNHYDISTYCIKGENHDTYYQHIQSALNLQPTLTMDDGADTVGVIHSERRELIPGIIGGTEETTTGVIRLRAMAKDGVLQYPIIAVNDADTKHLFDNRYGTGQSTLDGIIRATNTLIAGKVVVICGYGWCGRGVAKRADGLGARVVVTEIDPTKAIEAVMDGFEVRPILDAAHFGDLFITVTGNKNVISKEVIGQLKSGAIICNSGHFNAEIDIKALEGLSNSHRVARPFVEEFNLHNGRTVYLLGEGRLINLAAAEGHPASVMDMSFANQALCAEYLTANYQKMDRNVYSVPTLIDRKVAQLKLEAMGVSIDTLTEEQERYMNSWNEGT